MMSKETEAKPEVSIETKKALDELLLKQAEDDRKRLATLEQEIQGAVQQVNQWQASVNQLQQLIGQRQAQILTLNGRIAELKLRLGDTKEDEPIFRLTEIGKEQTPGADGEKPK